MAAIIQKIRAGNQFTYLWAIERAGVAVDLTTATDIELSYGVGKPCADYSKIPFTVVYTNKISSSHLYAVTGTYNLKLEFKIDGEQSTIDIDAFKIVPRSEDASDSAEFAVTSDMAIGFKGEKLTFADLTTSDIAELQKPANDAIASIQAVEVAISDSENNRVDAEHDRNQEEINRQEQEVARQANTSTAIQNAETATTSANTSTTNANTATTNANNAATLANTKAGLADTAATNANNVANGYAAELALKEVKANKQNSLATDGTGTKFPTVDAVNAGLDKSYRFICEYVHSSNLECNVTSYDNVTGTFTVPSHPFVNGNYVYATMRIMDTLPRLSNYTPVNLGTRPYFIINATPTSLQLSETNNGSAVLFANNSTQDCSKFKFEKTPQVDIDINNLPNLRSVKIVINLLRLSDTGVFQIFPNKTQFNFLNITEAVDHFYASIVVNTNLSSWGIIEANIDCSNDFIMANVEQNMVISNGTDLENRRRAYLSKSSSHPTINSLNFNHLFPANGCRIKIYGTI